MNMAMFWNIVRLAIALLACAAMIACMAALYSGVGWMQGRFGAVGALPYIALVLLIFVAIGIWIEKREQKRLGVKRPIFRWNND
jgi:hypothetical protein